MIIPTNRPRPTIVVISPSNPFQAGIDALPTIVGTSRSKINPQAVDAKGINAAVIPTANNPKNKKGRRPNRSLKLPQAHCIDAFPRVCTPVTILC